MCVKAVVPILKPFCLHILHLQADMYAGKKSDAFDCQDKPCARVSTGMKGSECMMGRKPRAAANCFSFLSELSHLPFALIHCPVQSQFRCTVHSSEMHFGAVYLSAVQMIGSGLALSEEDWHSSSSIRLPPRLPGRDCWACCCPHCSH